jgi:hypothetical protein
MYGETEKKCIPGELEINGTRKLLVYADDVNILHGSTHIIKKNTETLAVTSMEIGLEVKLRKQSICRCLETSIQDKITA